MAAKKAVSRQATGRKKTGSLKRKVDKSKSPAKKKPVARKKAVVKKALSRKKAGKKKSVSKKKPAASKQAVSKRKSAIKKKSVSKKQPATKKKSVSKKKTVAKKPASKKQITGSVARPKKAAAAKVTRVRKPPVKSKAKRGDVLSGPNHGILTYEVKRGEEYMSRGQLAHFRQILTFWKDELMGEVDRTVHHMQDEAANFPDPNDRATQESEFGLELRTRDRERKLIRKISSAITRTEDGSYGYCEETGEEIGLKRLEARPVATLCLEAQERREMSERQFRDRDDRYR